jgi:beta-glucanase (GH16 family)
MLKTLPGFVVFLSLPLAGLAADAPAPAAPKAAEPAPAEPVFASTPPLELSGQHDFPDAKALNDEAAGQLTGLCSLAEFRALPEADRHVYSFEPWPGGKDSLEQKSGTFHFQLGAVRQKIAFVPTGGGPNSKASFTRVKDPATGRYALRGLGNLDWSGVATHTFKFDKPVGAFGVVLNSSADMEVRKFYWAAAKERNGYPLSYTLADGSIVQLGQRELRGALLKGETDAFLGVLDRSGRGIVSFTYTLRGLAGNKAQSIGIKQLAFATMPKPEVAAVINLRSSCDFASAESILPSPTPLPAGLSSLADFRFIVPNKRYVYSFDTWPQDKKDLGSNAGEFAFDLQGKGTAGQKITLQAAVSGGSPAPSLTQMSLKKEDGLSYPVLGGLGTVRKGSWAEQTFKFEKPVRAFGVTYRSLQDARLAESSADGKTQPLSYTLSDGSVVHVGSPGAEGGLLAKDGRTFVGVIDRTDKGIVSATLRVEGTAAESQPLYIEDLAFALGGPPPGNWKLVLEDNFDGDKLNPEIWAPGYLFKDVINNELQGYVPENISVANGLCTIKVEQRDCFNTDREGHKGPAQKFASGAFTSYDKFTATYGYFEARLRMPHARGAGVWPAFWMLPDRGKDYPDKIRRSYRTKDYGMGLEIDIFEFMPWWKRLDGLYPIHVGCIWSYGKVTETDPAPHGYGSYALGNDGWGPEELYYSNPDTEFHTYGLYWSPERLIYYLDSKPIFRVKDPQHVPDVPHYFLFNIALSGNGWGKSPDKKHPTMAQIIEDMPNSMEIDYFRAYAGTLEEAVPASSTDDPSIVRKYTPPPKDQPAPAAPAQAPASAPAAPDGGVPEAPVNSTIVSPSNG